MPSHFDSSEFVDNDFVTGRKSPFATSTASASVDSGRAPTREEIDSKVGEAQTRLAELKRAQEQLEQERAALEEMRRRQSEFQTGREEMLQSLTRGVGLLEEAEFSARLQAEQMSKTMAGFRDALEKIKAVHEEHWNKENYNIELTRALTTLENARMEWNSAKLKFPVLSGTAAAENKSAAKNSNPAFSELNFLQLCKFGFALTWPLVLLGLGIFAMLLLKK